MPEPVNENPETPKQKPRPGLMVEDHNAVVETDEAGRQAVRKVPDRAAEAERKGVSESKI